MVDEACRVVHSFCGLYKIYLYIDFRTLFSKTITFVLTRTILHWPIWYCRYTLHPNFLLRLKLVNAALEHDYKEAEKIVDCLPRSSFEGTDAYYVIRSYLGLDPSSSRPPNPYARKAISKEALEMLNDGNGKLSDKAREVSATNSAPQSSQNASKFSFPVPELNDSSSSPRAVASSSSQTSSRRRPPLPPSTSPEVRRLAEWIWQAVENIHAPTTLRGTRS